MLYTSTILAVLGLATLGRSHMKMATPVPFGESTLNNSPLAADGSDFPCKQRAGVYDAEGASNSLPLGSTQTVSFVGSAVHGGGSCQFSISYDANPTKSSVFKVIHSIEGGCPMKNVTGNNGDSASQTDPDTYSFSVPSSLPTGTATLAWTWFNKVGNREMYMNCAPVTITSGSAKRSEEDEELAARKITQLMERDQTAFNALPDMFVANIGNGCSVAENVDVQFPSPGDSLEQLGLQTAVGVLGPPNGTCGATVAAAVGGSKATAAAPAPTSAPTQATSAPASPTTALSGGVFITLPSSTEPDATSGSSVGSAATPVASQAAPSVTSTPAASAAAPASSGISGSGAGIAAGTACTPEGEWNCVGGNSFQQCASGTWSVVQSLAAGTSCTPGQSSNINIVAAGSKKRSVRFSSEHVRRNLQGS